MLPRQHSIGDSPPGMSNALIAAGGRARFPQDACPAIRVDTAGMFVRRGALLAALMCAVGVCLLLFAPVHIHVAGGSLPVVVGAAPPLAPQDTPPMVLDCGSVVHHGPQWNPNGGDCEGRLVGRKLAAEGIGALGVLFVLLTVASLLMGAPKARDSSV